MPIFIFTFISIRNFQQQSFFGLDYFWHGIELVVCVPHVCVCVCVWGGGQVNAITMTPWADLEGSLADLINCFRASSNSFLAR